MTAMEIAHTQSVFSRDNVAWASEYRRRASVLLWRARFIDNQQAEIARLTSLCGHAYPIRIDRRTPPEFKILALPKRVVSARTRPGNSIAAPAITACYVSTARLHGAIILRHRHLIHVTLNS